VKEDRREPLDLINERVRATDEKRPTDIECKEGREETRELCLGGSTAVQTKRAELGEVEMGKRIVKVVAKGLGTIRQNPSPPSWGPKPGRC